MGRISSWNIKTNNKNTIFKRVQYQHKGNQINQWKGVKLTEAGSMRKV